MSVYDIFNPLTRLKLSNASCRSLCLRLFLGVIVTVGDHTVVRLLLIVSGDVHGPGVETGLRNLQRGSAVVVETAIPREIGAGIVRETEAGTETVIETGTEIERGNKIYKLTVVNKYTRNEIFCPM